MLTRSMVREEMRKMGLGVDGKDGNGNGNGNRIGGEEEDEEVQMARMLDEKVAAVGA